jgi:hypothetical protein
VLSPFFSLVTSFYTEITSKIGFLLRRLAMASNACLHRVSLLKLTLLYAPEILALETSAPPCRIPNF